MPKLLIPAAVLAMLVYGTQAADAAHRTGPMLATPQAVQATAVPARAADAVQLAGHCYGRGYGYGNWHGHGGHHHYRPVPVYRPYPVHPSYYGGYRGYPAYRGYYGSRSGVSFYIGF